jgi:hypothetical protein
MKMYKCVKIPDAFLACWAMDLSREEKIAFGGISSDSSHIELYANWLAHMGYSIVSVSKNEHNWWFFLTTDNIKKSPYPCKNFKK